MSIAFLNGDYIPLAEAKISPMDRGFLFGDGIYEVLPSFGGKIVGLSRHLQRLETGLDALRIPFAVDGAQLAEQLTTLAEKNGAGPLGLYLQISRGVSERRAHRFPEHCTPTVFAHAFPIAEPCDGHSDCQTQYRVSTGRDLRWQRCHIKSVALLGNVLHMMEGVDSGNDEILLFNERDELTEAAACNVFIVRDGEVATPELDHQKLPGITRNMLIDMMRAESGWRVSERSIQRNEVMTADEVWLTSSTKEVAPVVAIDGQSVGAGTIGEYWYRAQQLFARERFNF